jgi:hypothetical protein
MLEKVTIPISLFEYSVDFRRPVVALWMDRAKPVQEIFDALSRWSLDINDIEPITQGKPSDQGIRIRLTKKRCTIFFGPASFKFTKDDADWASAEETINILKTALDTVVHVSGAELIEHKTAFAFHMQPLSKTFLEILRPVLSSALESLLDSKMTTGASIVKWRDGRIVLDGSGSLANGIYVRFEQNFKIETDFGEIAKQLRSAEDAIFRLLNVEEGSE